MRSLKKKNTMFEASQKGRLTIFSDTFCAQSTLMKNVLSDYELFFVEIDLGEYPDRLKDLKRLRESEDESKIPQLFCNNHHVASNASQLINLLSSWQQDYGSVFAGYEASLEKYPSYHDSRLRLPCHLSCTSVANRSLTIITLPNPQRRTSLVQVARYLIKNLPNEILRSKKRKYRSSFYGRDLLVVLKRWLQSTDKQAEAFGWQLMDYGLILPLEKNVTIIERDYTYRLRAFDRPSVLNWSFPFLGNALDTTLLSPSEVLLQLCRILDNIFQKHGTSSNDMLQCAEFEYFEEAVSTLQKTRLPVGDSIFLINLYNLMVRHALIVCNRLDQCWQNLLSKISYQFQDTLIRLNEIKERLSNDKKIKFPTFVCCSKLQKFDPRYLLLCSSGTLSCPVIRIYENESDIYEAVRDYAQREVQLNGNELRIPQIFSSFTIPEQDLMEWIIQFLDGNQLKSIADYHNDLVIKYKSRRNWTRITDNSNSKEWSSGSATEKISSGSVPLLKTSHRYSLIRNLPKRSVTLRTASVSNFDCDGLGKK